MEGEGKTGGWGEGQDTRGVTVGDCDKEKGKGGGGGGVGGEGRGWHETGEEEQDVW